MSINVYQLWEALGDVDQDIVYEIREYQKISEKKKLHQFSVRKLAAGVAIFVLGISGAGVFLFGNKDAGQIFPGNNKISISENKGDVIIETTSAPGKKPVMEKIEINEESSYFGAKYGGTITSVKKEVWLKSFDPAVFMCDAETKYYISYSREQEVLYGVLEMAIPGNDTLSIRVGENSMIDSGYSELKMSNINGVEMAICSIGGDSDEEGKSMGAIYMENKFVYTIEKSETNISDFVSTLKAIVKTK